MLTACAANMTCAQLLLKFRLAVICECYTALAALHNYTALDSSADTEREEIKTLDSVIVLVAFN